MSNQDLLDAISVVSFLIGVANYNENLSQSDKDDMIQTLNEKMKSLLDQLEEDLEYQNSILEKQNEMLLRILAFLEGGSR